MYNLNLFQFYYITLDRRSPNSAHKTRGASISSTPITMVSLAQFDKAVETVQNLPKDGPVKLGDDEKLVVCLFSAIRRSSSSSPILPPAVLLALQTRLVLPGSGSFLSIPF